MKPFQLNPDDHFVVDSDKEERVLTKLSAPTDAASLDVYAFDDNFNLVKVVGNLDVTKVDRGLVQ